MCLDRAPLPPDATHPGTEVNRVGPGALGGRPTEALRAAPGLRPEVKSFPSLLTPEDAPGVRSYLDGTPRVDLYPLGGV